MLIGLPGSRDLSMNRDEQKQIIEFIERAAGTSLDAVKATIDVEADAIIRALFVRNPDAAYRVTMLAMRQEQELEWLQTQQCGVSEPKVQGLRAKLLRLKLWLQRLLHRGAAQQS